MTWYNSNWKNRYPIAIDCLGGSESSGAIDVSIIFPKDWDFWDKIRSDGFDIVLTDSMGVQLTFQRQTYNFANKDLVLQGDNITVGNQNSVVLLYVYYNNPDQASDLAGSFTVSSAKNGRIYLNAPSSRIIGDPTQKTGTNTPNYSFSRTSTDEVYIWFNVKSLLASRISTYNGKLDFESVDYVQIFSYDAGGSDDTNRYNEALTCFIPGWIGILSKGGSNNNDYTYSLNIRTTGSGPFNQTICLKCLVLVRDLLPT